MAISTVPFGFVHSHDLANQFRPTRPITISYFGVDRFGFALGFSQRIGDEYFGAIFVPKIHVIEWKGGDIVFGPKTIEAVQSLWLRLYGLEPVIASASCTVEP